MNNCRTLGAGEKAVEFTYQGAVKDGVKIQYETEEVDVSKSFIEGILKHFSGKRVAGGFSADDPAVDGFGEWVRDNSHQNSRALTPKHSSRIAAILVSEGFAECERQGHAVYLRFKE